MPPHLHVKKLFRAQNMPQSLTAAELNQWIGELSWAAKAIKKVNRSAYG